jgi:hypothetical protein
VVRCSFNYGFVKVLCNLRSVIDLADEPKSPVGN